MMIENCSYYFESLHYPNYGHVLLLWKWRYSIVDINSRTRDLSENILYCIIIQFLLQNCQINNFYFNADIL